MMLEWKSGTKGDRARKQETWAAEEEHKKNTCRRTHLSGLFKSVEGERNGLVGRGS